MFKNYLLVALRNMRRFKGYSFINIFGLAIGLCCAILILLWVQDKLSYDKFHKNAKNLYRVEQNQFYGGQPYHVNVTPLSEWTSMERENPGNPGCYSLCLVRRSCISSRRSGIF